MLKSEDCDKSLDMAAGEVIAMTTGRAGPDGVGVRELCLPLT